MLFDSVDVESIDMQADHERLTAERIARQASTMYTDGFSQSSSSSPKSQKASIGSIDSQISSIPNTQRDELTPPSSIASSHNRENDCEDRITGRKRTASGEYKEAEQMLEESAWRTPKHVPTASALSCASGGSLTELSQSLKTKLTYAMVKVQNGWQDHSLEEVESLASQSPHSTISVKTKRRSLLSPRVAIAAMREASDLSSLSANSQISRLTASGISHVSEPETRGKVLAPPADIVAGSRKRAATPRKLQIHTMGPPGASRPKVQQRTPSQNAAMEADAVETLMFMSASPNNSGHFPTTFSPVSQTFSAQTSPLKSTFSPRYPQPIRKYEDTNVLIDRLLDGLDDDASNELDRAVHIMEQHRSTKMAT